MAGDLNQPPGGYREAHLAPYISRNMRLSRIRHRPAGSKRISQFSAMAVATPKFHFTTKSAHFDANRGRAIDSFATASGASGEQREPPANRDKRSAA